MVELTAATSAPVIHRSKRCCGRPLSAWGLPHETSEGSSAIEENEDHSRSSQRDHGEGREVGDQVEIEAHVWKTLTQNESTVRLRVATSDPLAGFNAL